MNLMRITLFLATIILFVRCVIYDEEPLYAITNLKEFTHSAAEMKFQKVVPISKEEIIGDWTMIASFFTIKSQQLVTTFQLEGRKYIINDDGSLIIDNKALGVNKRYRTLYRNWSIETDNHVFSDGKESWYVRVQGDTMEWLSKNNDDYLYYVLLRTNP